MHLDDVVRVSLGPSTVTKHLKNGLEYFKNYPHPLKYSEQLPP